ncbi:zinc finger protein domain [Teratosphaeria destructans]|uniref:Zinc finger protein domain n=1 Tax=Teratosphaeria destructans TaxID=418781 RepID=A0A9W7SPI1_9PEZI|nr:zinc finger protein domain [Teratosphaeria destructans]
MAVPSSYSGRNRPAATGGPSGVHRSYASQLREPEALFHSYEHLQGLPRPDTALTMLRKVASMVKPIMRKRAWKVQILAEFLPAEPNLLGLNINRGYKVCIRLRYHNHPDLFLPIEQVVDTMLHELSHNVWGDHDTNFHRLWDDLRDEHEVLLRKGFTGEGFLSEGHRLGGGRDGAPPPQEMRRLARASAEKRQAQGTLGKGSGQRLGGTPLHRQGGEIRTVIADQVLRRNTVDRACASGRGDADKLSEQSANNTFKTRAEEDDANDRAIAQALYELIQEEEDRKLRGTYSAAPPGGGLAWDARTGLYQADAPSSSDHPSEEEQLRWAMQESAAAAGNSQSSTAGLSPVSPLTPDTQAPRSSSSPPIPAQIRSKAATISTSSSHATNKPLSRLVKPADEQAEASKRTEIVPNPSDPTSSTAQPPPTITSPVIDISEPFNPDEWACEICTCINPVQFLACDACGTERPQTVFPPTADAGRSRSTPTAPNTGTPTAGRQQGLGWNCRHCGSFMEHQWWTCSACGVMKTSS